MNSSTQKLTITNYILAYSLVLVVGYSINFFVSQKTEKVSTINPENGVTCVIVSRAFNTSVDCWKK